MPEVTYHVKAAKTRGEFVKIYARDHRVIVDEPIEKGGTDAGMNPVELLLGSIASCMTITLSIYAEAMGVKAEDITVNVEGDLDSAGQKGSARVRPGFLRIRMDISAKTNVSEETFQQVVDLACLRCPVEDSVSKGVEFGEPTLHVEAMKTEE